MPREKRAKVRSPLRTAESSEGTFDSPIEPQEVKKSPKTRTYIVKPKHKIYLERDVPSVAGTIIELDSKMAKHFLARNCIEPYVEFDDDED